jgi:hypothetical protein
MLGRYTIRSAGWMCNGDVTKRLHGFDELHGPWFPRENSTGKPDSAAPPPCLRPPAH